MRRRRKWGREGGRMLRKKNWLFKTIPFLLLRSRIRIQSGIRTLKSDPDPNPVKRRLDPQHWPGVHQGSVSWEHLHKKPKGPEYIKKQMYRSYCLAFIDIYLYKNVKKLLISSKNHQNSDICGYEALIIILYAFLTNKNDFWIHISHNLCQNAPKTSELQKPWNMHGILARVPVGPIFCRVTVTGNTLPCLTPYCISYQWLFLNPKMHLNFGYLQN